MAEPEYTVTVTIATVDPALAEYARNEGASLVRLVEELASRGDARTLTHTGVETATDLDPMATLVDQLATAVADELERRERERSPLLFLRSCPFCTEPVERHQRTPEGGVVCPTVEGAPQP